MPTINSDGAIQSLVTPESTPDLFTCPTITKKDPNDLRCQLEALCDKTKDSLSFSNDILTLSGSDGSVSDIDLSVYLDNTDTLYSLDLTGDDLTLSGSDGSIANVDLSQYLDDTVVTYDQTFDSNILTLSGSNGDVIDTDLSSLDQSIPLSNLSAEFYDCKADLINDIDFLSAVEYNLTLSGNDLTLSNNVGDSVDVDLSQYLDDTDTTYDIDLNGTDLTLSGSDGSIKNVDLSSFLDDTNTTYELVKNGNPTVLPQGITEGTNTYSLGSATITTTGVLFNPTTITAGVITFNGEVATIANVGDVFTDSNGNTIEIISFPTADDMVVEVTTFPEFNIGLSGSDGTFNSIDLFACLSSVFLDDTDTTYTQFFDITSDILTLSGSDGVEVDTDLSSLNQTVPLNNLSAEFYDCKADLEADIDFLSSVEYDITLVGNDLTLSNTGNGDTSTVDLTQFLDDTVVTYDIDHTVNPTDIEITLSGSDGNTQTTNIPTTTGTEADGKVDLTLPNGDTFCSIACPPAGTPTDAIPKVQPDGSIDWVADENTTYTITQTALVGGQTQITLQDSEGNPPQVITLPYGGDGVISSGVYLPDSSDVVTIPITQLQPSGITANIGNVQIDLSGLIPVFGGGYYYNPTTNQYTHIDSNGATQTADITDVDTSVAGQVTFTDPNGDTVTLPTVDQGGFTFDLATNTYVHSSSNGNTQSVPATNGTVNTDGTTDINLPNGTDVCLISCPPAGTPDGAVPTTQPDGSVLWEVPVDENTTYTFTQSGDDLIVTPSNGAPQTLADVFLDTDTIDVSQFSAVTVNGVTTITHTANGVSTPVQIPLGVSSVSTISNPGGDTSITYVDGAGVIQTAGVIPAGSTSTVTQVTNPDGSVTNTHVAGGVTTTWVTNTSGADDQIASEVPFSPATSNLTATDTQGAIDELANENRAWSQNGTQKTNADGVLYTDGITQNNKVAVNTTATGANTFYVSNAGSGGDGNARFDSTIGVRVNATGETGAGVYDTLIYNSGRTDQFKYNVIRASTGDQAMSIEGGVGGSDASALHGAGCIYTGNQFTGSATAYPEGSSMWYSGKNSLSGDKARLMITNIILSTDAEHTNTGKPVSHQRSVNQTSIDLYKGVFSLRENASGASGSIPNRNDYVNLFTFGGAFFAKSSNDSFLTPPNTVVQLTGHLSDIVSELQEAGVITKEVNAELISVQPTYDVANVLVAFNVLGDYYEVNLASGEYKKVSSEGVEKGNISITEERKSIVSLPELGLKGTPKERLDYMEKQTEEYYAQYVIFEKTIANTGGVETAFEITEEELPEELKGLKSYTVKVTGSGKTDDDEYITIDGQTVKGLSAEETITVSNLTGVSLTGGLNGVDSAEAYTLTITR